MVFIYANHIPPQNFGCLNLIKSARNSFYRGDMEETLTCYERAFSICTSNDPLKQKISMVVIKMIREDLIPKISHEDAEKLFPHQTFIATGQPIGTLLDLIEWKHRNNDLGPQSSLQIVRWYNALGDLEGVNKVCAPFLCSYPNELIYEFYLENAIAYLQAGDFQKLKEICRRLDGSTDPEIVRYTKIMKREVFLQGCFQRMQFYGPYTPLQNFQWQ